MAISSPTRNPVQDFIRCLAQAETERRADPLVALFADTCRLTNVRTPRPLTGTEGAHRFWTEYLSAFREIRSRFTRVAEGRGYALLEWVSEGRMADGQEIAYEGVTVIDFDERDGRIRSFRAYFDPSELKVRSAERRPEAGDRSQAA